MCRIEYVQGEGIIVFGPCAWREGEERNKTNLLSRKDKEKDKLNYFNSIDLTPVTTRYKQ